MATGGHDTEKHFHDTIERKRTVDEAQKFLTDDEIKILKDGYHSGPFSVWGSVPGPGNIRTWTTMEDGDYVLIYKDGNIIFAAEVALKVRNPKMSEYLWGKDVDGKTWECMYFLVNTEKVIVPMLKLNHYLGYEENYTPRGFGSIDKTKSSNLLTNYGDILSALRKIEQGEELKKVDVSKVREIIAEYETKIESAPTEHDEIQWRLIRMGKRLNTDVWIPRSDQGKSYEGHAFRNDVLQDFQDTLDVPPYIKNIDVVWKYGYSIKSAFEIEHSTSVYSGILRLSDLRALAPNSNYPLFIVASRDRKNKVFNELQRPTFNNSYLNLKDAISFLSYDKIRQLDNEDTILTQGDIVKAGERIAS